MNETDYVIVGGGTAASVVAHRLSERGHTVCVLEAGPSDDSPYIRIPVGFAKTLGDQRYTWQFNYEPSPGTNGRQVPLVQGKTLGGSSSVNGVVYNRGQASDFDRWAALGNPGWSYSDVLPYFRKTERFSGEGDDHYRGRDGLIPTSEPAWSSQVCSDFLSACEASGMRRNPDYNGASQDGVGVCQSMIGRGERWSAARAYLHPARRQHKLHVVTGAFVQKVLVKEGRAIGVVYKKHGQHLEWHARKEVIVCAGAINSPKLLQLSGIGPARLLAEIGISVVHDLPGVGENLQDHFTPRLVLRAKPGVYSINQRVKGLPLVAELIAWLLKKPSILGISPILVYGFWKSRTDLPTPDSAITFTPASYKLGMLGVLDDQPGFTCGAWQLRPESKGFVRIASSDAQTSPIIQPNFLQHETDQQVIVAVLKQVRRILSTDIMQSLIETELLPGAEVASDDELLNFARQYGMTGYHPSGTCKMGPKNDPRAVVDSNLRVHGIRSLRVVDASIMPVIPSANTCASTLMIGEKASDLILADA